MRCGARTSGRWVGTLPTPLPFFFLIYPFSSLPQDRAFAISRFRLCAVTLFFCFARQRYRVAIFFFLSFFFLAPSRSVFSFSSHLPLLVIIHSAAHHQSSAAADDGGTNTSWSGSARGRRWRHCAPTLAWRGYVRLQPLSASTGRHRSGGGERPGCVHVSRVTCHVSRVTCV